MNERENAIKAKKIAGLREDLGWEKMRRIEAEERLYDGGSKFDGVECMSSLEKKLSCGFWE